MNADGSNQTRLTSNPAQERWSAWSPDGQKIVFTSYRDNDWEIYEMNAADGTEVNRLTTWAGLDAMPDWQPLPTTTSTTATTSTEEQGDYVSRGELFLYLGILTVVFLAIVLTGRRGSRRSASTPSILPAAAPVTPTTVPYTVSQPPTTTEHCSQCGSIIPEAAKFCTICGEPQPKK